MLVVLLMAVLMGGAALTIDVGAAYAYKQKCESVVEAAALAAASRLPNAYQAQAAADEIIAANGLSGLNVTITTPYQTDITKVMVAYYDAKPTYFAKTLGINLFQINSQAVARHGGAAVFDYALFSASVFDYLDIGGADVHVEGHVHSNEDIKIHGADLYVSGQLDATGIVDVRGSTVVAGSIVNYMPVIGMPVYDVNVLRAACETRYIGSQHWSGVTINVDGNVFVEGDLKLSGVTITGTGMLICSGDIELAGTGLYYAGETDKVCVYSLDDIHITGTNYYADGILYAPTGEIDSHGASLTVNGSIVGDLLDLSGVDVTVNHDADAKNAFFGGYSSLTR